MKRVINEWADENNIYKDAPPPNNSREWIQFYKNMIKKFKEENPSSTFSDEDIKAQLIAHKDAVKKRKKRQAGSQNQNQIQVVNQDQTKNQDQNKNQLDLQTQQKIQEIIDNGKGKAKAKANEAKGAKEAKEAKDAKEANEAKDANEVKIKEKPDGVEQKDQEQKDQEQKEEEQKEEEQKEDIYEMMSMKGLQNIAKKMTIKQPKNCTAIKLRELIREELKQKKRKEEI